jgi:hypothetical protein|tara:strand:- start:1222 stop:1551 length:330 start_codon:yes stop_codon:yes gene_type:complete
MDFINTEDAGPPLTLHHNSPEDDSVRDRYPQYPETPEHSHQEEEPSTLYTNALTCLCIAIAIAHLCSMWTLRTDINILMEYQKENTQQYAHISTLLQNMQQVRWQMVAA